MPPFRIYNVRVEFTGPAGHYVSQRWAYRVQTIEAAYKAALAEIISHKGQVISMEAWAV